MEILMGEGAYSSSLSKQTETASFRLISQHLPVWELSLDPEWVSWQTGESLW